MLKHFLLIGLSLVFAFSAIAAPQMSVSPQVVSYGNRVQLILSDNKPIQNTPDLNQLQKDFTIRGQQQMQSTSIVNGVRNETHQLILSLFPRQKGTLTIGPFDWNGTRLPAVQVEVIDGQTTTNNIQPLKNRPQNPTSTQQQNGNHIFSAEAQLQPAEIYEGESTLYIVRITENIGLSQAQIQTPDNAQYTLTLFGQDKMAKTTVQGQPARLYERVFILTPNQTGSIQIDGGSVLGLVPDTSIRRTHPFDSFPDMFGHADIFNNPFGMPQKEVYIGTNNVTLTVKPKPASWTGWWLPSRHVALKEQYKMPPVITVGQPIERYVQLSAVGVDGNKLPLVVQPVNQSVKAYANPEKRTIIPSESDIVGYEEIMFVIVPTKTGNVTIPAIRVEWFNTKTGQKEIAELPAKTIDVMPTDNTMAAPINTQAENTTPPSQIESDTSTPITQTAIPSSNIMSNETTQSPPPSISESFWTSIKQIWTAFGIFELLMTIIVLSVLGILTYLARKRNQKRYLYQDNQINPKRKNKKPLPDLYPFK